MSVSTSERASTTAAAAAKPLKIFFQSLDAAGHLSACFGLAQALVQRGHQVTFFLAATFKGQAAKFGCREVIFNDDDKSENDKKPTESLKTENPIKQIASAILETGILGPKSPLEKVDLMSNPTFFEQTWSRLIARNDQIQAEMDAVSPDLFILDLFLVLPCIQQRSIPYVSIFSGNPLFLYDHPSIPPGCSGFRTDSNPATWTVFREKFAQYTSIFKVNQAKLNAHFNFVPDPAFEQSLKNVNTDFVMSPYLNLVGYPKELTYNTEQIKLPETFLFLDAFCRQESSQEFVIPKQIQEMPGKALIYFSLGSMGGYDVELLKRILFILRRTPHRYIVSKGLRGAEFDFPPNCWGEAYLPQTAILPLVDLVITHGGNNSFTEAFSFGKKMIVLPLFADQYDNGTRVVELGYGESLNPYQFRDEDLIEAIDRLLGDEKLTAKMANVRERIVRENTKAAACQAIEKLVKT